MFILEMKTPGQSRTLNFRCLNQILQPEIRKPKSEGLSQIATFSENPSTNIFCFCVICMLFFNSGRNKTASLRKIRQLCEGMEMLAASKRQVSWKPRKAAPLAGGPGEGALGQ